MRATYDMLDLKTKCCPTSKAEGNILSETYKGKTKFNIDLIKVQHIICSPNPQSIIVVLYLYWLRIKYSIQTIHQQTDHDQTGLNLDELILDELALV